MKRARFWQLLDDGSIRCELCPRACHLQDGQRGFCYVRQQVGKNLVTHSYATAAALAIDPIEKKPLYHFLPGSKVLSLGTIGCNLDCKFCQNSSLSRGVELGNQSLAPVEIARTAIQHSCSSVAFTYNDPIVFTEYAIDAAKECHNFGLQTVAVSNGWMAPTARQELFAVMDAANIDLKSFSPNFYKQLCSATLQPVLDTLIHIRKMERTWLECTTLLIPGKNDSPEELDAMTRWIVDNLGSDIPWHFSAYHPTEHWNSAPPTPLATLQRAEKIARKNGMQHVYLGNV